MRLREKKEVRPTINHISAHRVPWLQFKDAVWWYNKAWKQLYFLNLMHFWVKLDIWWGGKSRAGLFPSLCYFPEWRQTVEGAGLKSKRDWWEKKKSCFRGRANCCILKKDCKEKLFGSYYNNLSAWIDLVFSTLALGIHCPVRSLVILKILISLFMRVLLGKVDLEGRVENPWSRPWPWIQFWSGFPELNWYH